MAYLRDSFAAGEEAELRVGLGGGSVCRYQGRLSEFDLDTLGMLYELQRGPDLTGEYDNLFSQVCVTIEI